MRQRARQAIFSVAATAIFFALTASYTRGEVLIEVDLSQANKIIFNATEGSSLVTRQLGATQIMFFDDLLQGLEIEGNIIGEETISNLGGGNLTYAQAPGNQFTSLRGNRNIDGLSMLGSGDGGLFTHGERAFIGSREFALSSSDYNAIVSDAPFSANLYASVNQFVLTPTAGLIGQFKTNVPGFQGRSIELQVETVTNNGLIVTEPREAVVSNLSDEFADFNNVPLFDETGSPVGNTNVGVDIDLTHNTIRIDNYSTTAFFGGNSGFNGYVFTDIAGEVPPIVGVEIDPSTTVNLPAGDISFTADEIRVDVGGQFVNNSTQILLNVEFGEDLLIEGDYNGDGQVDGADYAVWRESLGQTGLGLAADGIQDNVIDQADFNLWRNNFGQQLSIEAAVASQSASSAATIPEPSALVLLCLGGALLGRGRIVR